jgi:hypothetical protein
MLSAVAESIAMVWLPPDDSHPGDPSDLQQRRSGAEMVAAVLRVHLTAEDLMRVRLSPGPAPMIELSLGVAGIRRREPSPAVLAWHAGLDRRLPRQSRALFDLIRPTGAGPLFLDPPCPSFAEGMDRVQSTSSEDLAADPAAGAPAAGPARTVGAGSRQTGPGRDAAARGGPRRSAPGAGV